MEIDFPGPANLVASGNETASQHPIATGPFDGGTVPTVVANGQLSEFTWQIDGASAVGLATTLRQQIERQGYAVPFGCTAHNCGGFDFRHSLPVGHAPEMHIDLGNYHYLTAMRDGEDGTHYAALMISQGGDTGFVHLALVRPGSPEAPAPVVLSTRSPERSGIVGSSELIDRLLTQGGAALEDLEFETGASELSGEQYASLIALAEFLNTEPERQIVLVGHTDASGSLPGNIELSRERAEAVRLYLIQELGVSPDQVDANGIGFLAPRATNDTPEGREANRRVEVVLALP